MAKLATCEPTPWCSKGKEGCLVSKVEKMNFVLYLLVIALVVYMLQNQGSF